ASLSMFGGASEKIIVIEFEIDNLAALVDGETRNVMSDVSIPIDPKWIVGFLVAAIPEHHGVRIDVGFLLVRSPRIEADRSLFVAIPKALDERHQQATINSVPLLLFGSNSGWFHLHDIAQLFFPKLGKRFLCGESRRR